jgi:hypothetical protein
MRADAGDNRNIVCRQLSVGYDVADHLRQLGRGGGRPGAVTCCVVR